MNKLDAVGLTKLELKIMQVIWRRGSSTVGQVQEELHPPLAYTTVQTMLNILERKGKLTRELNGRAYVYIATVTETKAHGQGLRDLIDRMFGGSSEELVMKSAQESADRCKAAGGVDGTLQRERPRRCQAAGGRCKEDGQKAGQAMSEFGSLMESRVLSYMLNSLWQVPLLFLAGWIAAQVAHRAGATAAHRGVISVLLLQGLLPALSLLPWGAAFVAMAARVHISWQ